METLINMKGNGKMARSTGKVINKQKQQIFVEIIIWKSVLFCSFYFRMMVCILTFEIHKEFTISIMVRSTKESSNMETRMAKVDNNSWQGIIWQLTRKKASENNFETISDFGCWYWYLYNISQGSIITIMVRYSMESGKTEREAGKVSRLSIRRREEINCFIVDAWFWLLSRYIDVCWWRPLWRGVQRRWYEWAR